MVASVQHGEVGRIRHGDAQLEQPRGPGPFGLLGAAVAQLRARVEREAAISEQLLLALEATSASLTAVEQRHQAQIDALRAEVAALRAQLAPPTAAPTHDSTDDRTS